MNCTRCNHSELFEVPDFSLEEKKKLLKIRRSSVILLVKEFLDNYGIPHASAKFIASHLNTENGHCHRCDFAHLSGENVTCPKCKSLNMNWSFD